LDPSAGTWRLTVTGAQASAYSNAQLDDYEDKPRARFPWRPPLTMTVRARFSNPGNELKGTAGFGFWNDPFVWGYRRGPALPRAIWFFFASPPSNMALDVNVPGRGWKAATIDADRPAFAALLPFLPFAVPLMNVPSLYRQLWPGLQHTMLVREALLDVDMTAWHTYELVWLPDHSRFTVDERVVLDDAPSPRGPLGFVLWMDNQYAIVTPWGQLGHGTLAVQGAQWLEISEITIENN
jgi:hypothetical protein